MVEYTVVYMMSYTVEYMVGDTIEYMMKYTGEYMVEYTMEWIHGGVYGGVNGGVHGGVHNGIYDGIHNGAHNGIHNRLYKQVMKAYRKAQTQPSALSQAEPWEQLLKACFLDPTLKSPTQYKNHFDTAGPPAQTKTFPPPRFFARVSGSDRLSTSIISKKGSQVR